jgi:hypothetical protein
MVPIFIASNSGYSGKTLLVLGLALKLQESGYSVGYIKPIGKSPVKLGSGVYDSDALFIKEALSLSDPLEVISPFVYSFETWGRIFSGEVKDPMRYIKKAVNAMSDRDFIIIGGPGNFFEGAALGLDSRRMISRLKAAVLLVQAWRGDLSMDIFLGARSLLKENLLGGIINKVPSSSLNHVREGVKPFLEKSGVDVFGIFEKDRLLEAVPIRELVEILNGKVLCCEDRLEDFVEHFSIGAMDVDSALSHFRRTPNKAVITGAHRSDIQLAAMETSTKCIILTGGLYTNDVVLGKAIAKGIPIISVSDDTFTTMDRIEGIMGKSRIRDLGKITRAKQLMDSSFDMERFLGKVKMTRGRA